MTDHTFGGQVDRGQASVQQSREPGHRRNGDQRMLSPPKIASALLAILLVTAGAIAESQDTLPQPPQVPAEQPPARALEGQEAAEQQPGAPGTLPANIPPLPPQALEKQANEDANEGNSEGGDFWTFNITDTLLAFFAGLLVLVTARLVRSTNKLWIASNDQIGLARQEFAATHRPKIIVHTCEVADDDSGTIGAQFTIVNEGVSPATIRNVATKIFMTGVLRPGAHLDLTPISGKVLESGQRMECAAFGAALESAIATHFNRSPSDPKLWCIGKITYADTQGRERETGFCRFYDPISQTWARAENSDYEYSY